MSRQERTVSVIAGEQAPEPDHSEMYYCHRELIKKKGRRKKSDPIEFRMRYIPWTEINNTELLQLVLYGLEGKLKTEMNRWVVLSHGLRREEVIGIIRGTIDPMELEANPVHRARDRLSKLIHNNWKYIHSQIRCNTLCWECPDAKPLECVLENKSMLRGEDI